MVGNTEVGVAHEVEHNNARAAAPPRRNGGRRTRIAYLFRAAFNLSSNSLAACN